MSDQIICSGGCERETVELRREVVLTSKVFAESDSPVNVGNLALFLTELARERLGEVADPDEGEEKPVVAADFPIRVRFVKSNQVVETPNTFAGTPEEALAEGWERQDEGPWICPECVGRADPSLTGGAIQEPPGAYDLYGEDGDDQDAAEDDGEGGGLGDGHSIDEESEDE